MWNSWILSRGPLGVKVFKTHLLEMVEGDMIVYIDADILINKPLDEFLKVAECESKGVGLFWEGHKKRGEFHSGVLVVKRGETESLLDAWRKELYVEGERRDQSALKRVIRDYEYFLFPNEWIQFPEREGEILLDSIFVHFTSSRRRYLSHYKEHFGIPEEKSFHPKWDRK